MNDNPNSQSPDALSDGIGGLSGRGEGESLRQLIETTGPLTWPVVRWFTLQLAETLEPLHRKGRAHGNLSPDTIRLAEPWPADRVVLDGDPTSAAGAPKDDLRALGVTLVWLLCGSESQAGLPADLDPEAREVLSALSGGRIEDASGLEDLLVSGLLDSLPSEDAAGSETSPDSSEFLQEAPRMSEPVFAGASPDTARTRAVPKIAAAAAILLLLVGGYFLIPKEPADHPAASQEKAAKEREANQRAELGRVAREKAAAELAATAKAAEELARKERIARELAAKELAEREQAAMELAQEEAIREQALRDADALVSRNEKVLESPASPASAKEQAFAEILPLAREGHLKAIELCGASYWQGSGVVRDQEEARRWFEKGAGLGNARSMLGLGNCFEQGIGGDKDMQAAAGWWKKAADLGEPLAMGRLGDYHNADPAAKDVRLAMEWWQKAADRGVPEAMTNLGILHSTGSVGDPDPAKAVELWQKASALGETRAMTELGYKYFNAEVAGKSEVDAFQLFLKAVDAKDPRAMTGLGVCYFTGRGTDPDKAEGAMWLRRAAELGEPTATRFLKQLEAADP